MSEPNFAVVDVETTGLSPRYHHRIAEVAVVTLDPAGKVIDRWETLINPQRDLGPQSIHGIRAAEILDAPTFAQVAPALAERLRGNVLVAHNLSFDANFLDHEFQRAGQPLPEHFLTGLCTMRLAHRYVIGNARSLAHCCEFLSVNTGLAHCAGDDAAAAAGLLSKYIDMEPDHVDWQRHLTNAAGVEWPAFSMQVAGFAPVLRLPDYEEPRHFLSRITDNMPEFAGPEQDEQYLMLLDRALLDRDLSVTEQRELVSLAEELGLSPRRCLKLHTYYLEQLVAAAWSDGIITPAEADDLRLVSAVLGVDVDVTARWINERPATDGAAAEPRPARIVSTGDQLVLTGAMTRPRDELATILEALGYQVGNTVTKKTALLVAADPDSLSGKAAKARKNGIPVVGENYLYTVLGVSY